MNLIQLIISSVINRSCTAGFRKAVWFASKVAGNLVRQYGQPSRKEKRLLSSEFEWHHRQNNPIPLKVKSGLVQLTYTDRQLQHLAASEIFR